ncbi:hypothetical protein OQJ18_13480 [Fluoribacter dumoffii]|uniref:hypothetical protein n=1 Tax=Fluoribacter dumoffii TaxID=463 RepID=UPI002243A91B|nr:hypothetical protein [Fluoribacter dumoffii]MCW8416893.1 hypothetical protein [Fluoribacter dumoffii]MCW8455267.1 hypothetical protein [Fluoribacter dumoffii]MCW8460656.1 hypothetical protein [Fluoribacter dumoffii]MCW8484136.1 hypothetical protein [Fluoribacter dumoffii]
MDKIVIFDTTLRDGEQAPGASMRVKEKIKLLGLRSQGIIGGLSTNSGKQACFA